MAQPDPVFDTAFYDGVPLRRLIAFLIDATLIMILGLLAWLVITVLTIGIGIVLFVPIQLAVAFAYRWLTLAARSATPGMLFLGIEIRNAQGGPLSPPEAAVHTGLFLALMMSVVGWLATGVAILVTERRQGIPDLVLGSVAINRPAE